MYIFQAPNIPTHRYVSCILQSWLTQTWFTAVTVKAVVVADRVQMLWNCWVNAAPSFSSAVTCSQRKVHLSEPTTAGSVTQLSPLTVYGLLEDVVWSSSVAALLYLVNKEVMSLSEEQMDLCWTLFLRFLMNVFFRRISLKSLRGRLTIPGFDGANWHCCRHTMVLNSCFRGGMMEENPCFISCGLNPRWLQPRLWEELSCTAAFQAYRKLAAVIWTLFL